MTDNAIPKSPDQRAESQAMALGRLLLNPVRAGECDTLRVSTIAGLALAAAVVFGLVFQFVFPRLEDSLPVLGTLRRGRSLFTGRDQPLVDFREFSRWSACGLAWLACWFAAALGAGWLARDRPQRNPGAALTTAACAGVPLLVASILAVPLYHIHYAGGMIPFAGLLIGAFIFFHILTRRYGTPAEAGIYIAPAVWSVQLFIFSRLLP